MQVVKCIQTSRLAAQGVSAYLCISRHCNVALPYIALHCNALYLKSTLHLDFPTLHYPTLHLILRAQVWYLYWVVVSIAVQCIVGCNAMRCHCLASNAMRGTQSIFPFLSQGSAQLPDWSHCPDSLHPTSPPPQLIFSYVCGLWFEANLSPICREPFLCLPVNKVIAMHCPLIQMAVKMIMLSHALSRGTSSMSKALARTR